MKPEHEVHPLHWFARFLIFVKIMHVNNIGVVYSNVYHIVEKTEGPPFCLSFYICCVAQLIECVNTPFFLL